MLASRPFRVLAPLVILLAIVVLYYGRGIPFLYFADSPGYLQQGLTFFEPGGYRPSAARSIGYPAFLALVTRFDHAVLSMIVVQALLAVAAYVVLVLHLRSTQPAIAATQRHVAGVPVELLPLWLAATASYSALHNFIVAMLPEVLFAAIALFALLSVTRVLAAATFDRWLLATALLASLLCALPMLLKPHWLFAGPLLLGLLVLKLAWAGWTRSNTPAHRMASLAAALLPIVVFGAALAPERYLGGGANSATEAFGARTAFCNRLPMINAALEKEPRIRLAPSPAADIELRKEMQAIQKSDTQPWSVLGFDGDRCTFSTQLQQTVARHFTDPSAQKAFYLGTYLRALAADPLPFVAMFVRQIVLGIEKTFNMFAINAPYFKDAETLGTQALAGTQPIGAGPLNDAERMKRTLLGQVVNAVLAIFFWSLQIAYFAIVLATLLVPAVRWRGWAPSRRRAFLLYVGLPVLVVLAHHAVVGIAHTFDIRRYAFNLYFVNLGLVATGGLFWLQEAQALRRREPQKPG